MKIQRLLSIIILLLNRRKMTARDLAGHFEVSVRTIYRDVETLNQSGIPVTTFQGYGGGLCIPDQYKLSRQILTFPDMVSILTTLKGVNQTLNNRDISRIIEKITALIPLERTKEYKEKSTAFLVDLDPWGREGRNRDLISTIHDAVTRSRLLNFAYAKPGQPPEQRSVEPHTLVFKGMGRYLLAFCRTCQDFRIFKISRIRHLETDPAYFIPRPVRPRDYFKPDYFSGPQVSLTLRFPDHKRETMEEYFGAGDMVPDPAGPRDGTQDKSWWLKTVTLPRNDWILSFLLGLGPDVELVSPQDLRQALAEKIHKMQKMYTNLT